MEGHRYLKKILDPHLYLKKNPASAPVFTETLMHNTLWPLISTDIHAYLYLIYINS